MNSRQSPFHSYQYKAKKLFSPSHWDWFLTAITKGEVVDEHGPDKISGYGLENVYYDLDKKYAPFNADSYASTIQIFLSERLR